MFAITPRHLDVDPPEERSMRTLVSVRIVATGAEKVQVGLGSEHTVTVPL